MRSLNLTTQPPQGNVAAEDPDAGLRIEDVLKFLALGHRWHLQLTSRTKQLAGLTLEQATLLASLSAAGGERTVGALAASLGRATHTITAAVDALERKHLVVRRRDGEGDRRLVRVNLTPIGRARLDWYNQAVKSLAAELVESLDRDSVTRVADAIRTTTDLLLDRLPDPKSLT